MPKKAKPPVCAAPWCNEPTEKGKWCCAGHLPVDLPIRVAEHVNRTWFVFGQREVNQPYELLAACRSSEEARSAKLAEEETGTKWRVLLFKDGEKALGMAESRVAVEQWLHEGGSRMPKVGTKAKSKAAKRGKKNPQPCMCECGVLTGGGRFLPGHDARLKGALQRAFIGGDRTAAKTLTELGWGKYVPDLDVVAAKKQASKERLASLKNGKKAKAKPKAKAHTPKPRKAKKPAIKPKKASKK